MIGKKKFERNTARQVSSRDTVLQKEPIHVASADSSIDGNHVLTTPRLLNLTSEAFRDSVQT